MPSAICVWQRPRRTAAKHISPEYVLEDRKVDIRLPGKGNSHSHGARPVHLTITMIKWIRTSMLAIKIYLSARFILFFCTRRGLYTTCMHCITRQRYMYALYNSITIHVCITRCMARGRRLPSREACHQTHKQDVQHRRKRHLFNLLYSLLYGNWSRSFTTSRGLNRKDRRQVRHRSEGHPF